MHDRLTTGRAHAAAGSTLAIAMLVIGSTSAPAGPIDLATGPDESANGYLRIGPDAYGSWASLGFGGNGDLYNPAAGCNGDPEPAEATFAAGFYLFVSGDVQELLSDNPMWQGALAPNTTLDREILQELLTSDTDGDGVDDTANSSFRVFSSDGSVDLQFDVTQEVAAIDEDLAEVWQTYVIVNRTATAIDFRLVRLFDGDLIWDVGNDDTDDNVGTRTQSKPELDPFLYVSEWNAAVQMPHENTAITLSSADADGYVGIKEGIDPDGDGPCPAYDAVAIWDNNGIPDCWKNTIAGVGGSDGDSTSDPDPLTCDTCDGSILLRIPLSIAANNQVTIAVRHTYGSTTPGDEGADCPWDCADCNAEVGILDLLTLLADWGRPGLCDLDGDGVGIADLLAMLANWGPCP